MAIHKESRKLNYSPQQLFDIIADVERYPEFLPLWQEVKVSKNNHTDSEHFSYYTHQTIQLGPARKRFCTETHLYPFKRIHIQSSDPQCVIEFSLNCQAASLLLRPIFDMVLLQTAHSIVSAFERRARLIYGN